MTHSAFFVAKRARRAIVSSMNASGSKGVPRPAFASASASTSEKIIGARTPSDKIENSSIFKTEMNVVRGEVSSDVDIDR